MNDLVTWLESHDKLAGWAQFLGAVLALGLTYVTAFAPSWRRKRRLLDAARRLLAHGYEVIESYHRTSQYFEPFSQSIRQASLTMTSLMDELARFPIYELDDQGPRSLARRLVTMGLLMSTVRLFLDEMARRIEGRNADVEERQMMRQFLGDQLTFAEKLLTGAELKRPEWPTSPSP